LTVGMRAECVVPEAQCAIKRSNKKPTPKSIASSPAVPGGPGGGGGGGSAPAADYRLKLARPLKPEEEELINQVYRLICTVHRLGYYRRLGSLTGYRTAGIGYHRDQVPFLDRVPGPSTVPGPDLVPYRDWVPYRDQVSYRKLFFTKVFFNVFFLEFLDASGKQKNSFIHVPGRPNL
jgi:hypothetical protein